ncbi:tRNA (cytosine-5-)-methyltransferase, partial [Podila humilis]
MDILPRMEHPPSYILLENVKGFEESDSRDLLVESLTGAGYEFQELLITPLQIGIPNSRMRYYCLARKTAKVGLFVQPVTGSLIGYIPSVDGTNGMKEFVDGRQQGDLSGLSTPASKRQKTGLSTTSTTTTTTTTADKATQKPDEEAILSDPTLAHRIETLEKYIEFKDVEDVRMAKYMIPDKTLLKYGRLFDIVKQSTRRSCCFTKGYHHFVESTGSILQLAHEKDTAAIFEEAETLKSTPTKDEAEKEANQTKALALMRSLGLRYFTENEVARLMGFPIVEGKFSFPDTTSLKQRYRVLGNSINVKVVGQLIQYLLASPAPSYLDTNAPQVSSAAVFHPSVHLFAPILDINTTITSAFMFPKTLITRTPATRSRLWGSLSLSAQTRYKTPARSYSVQPTEHTGQLEAEPYDVVIVGGGIAGSALACALASGTATRTQRIALVEAFDLSNHVHWCPRVDEYSNRVSSLTPKSVAFLKRIGVWSELDPSRIAACQAMQVWDGVSGARIIFDADHSDDRSTFLQHVFSSASSLPPSTNDANPRQNDEQQQQQQQQSPLAWMTENLHVQYGLQKQIVAHKARGVHLDIFEKTKVQAITATPSASNTDDSVSPSKVDIAEWPVISLDNGKKLQTRLLVGADGVNSPVRSFAKIESLGWDYSQFGLVATLQVDHHTSTAPDQGRGVAWQRFLPTGPIAMLPV